MAKQGPRLKIFSSSKNMVLGNNIKIAHTMFQRMIGLMFKERMEGFDGLLIRHCTSIHTFFMKYPIDAIFMDKNNKIIRIYRSLPPWRISLIHFGASQVLELPSGSVSNQFSKDDILEVLCIN